MRDSSEVFLEDVPRNPKQFRVLIVDHIIHEDTTVRHLVSSEPDFNVLAETHDIAQMQASMQRYKPHLVVLDVSLMGGSLHLLQQLRQDHNYKPILVLSDIEDPVFGLQVLRERANGYLIKRDATECLVTAMKRVMLGEIYMSESVRELINQHIDREIQLAPGGENLVHHLRHQVAVYQRYGLDHVQISKFLKLPMPQLMVLLEALEESFTLHHPAGGTDPKNTVTQAATPGRKVAEPRHFYK